MPPVTSPSAISEVNRQQPAPAVESVCAVVVTYHPQGNLLARLQAITSQVRALVIVDNGSSGTSLECLNSAANRLGLYVIRNDSNRGVAAALNQGAKWAQDRGCFWLLTVDQDTEVNADLVATLGDVYHDFPSPEKIAVIGSNFCDLVRDSQLASLRDGDRSWKEAKTVITSGSLVSLTAYRTIQEFEEDLFVDCVDFEYCLRARSMGFHVLMACKPLMQHSIGAATRHKLPWKITATSNHSPTRRYYMTRNQILLARRYFRNEPRWVLAMLYRHLKETILLCLFEKNVGRKLKGIALGAWDGLSSNLHRRLS